MWHCVGFKVAEVCMRVYQDKLPYTDATRVDACNRSKVKMVVVPSNFSSSQSVACGSKYSQLSQLDLSISNGTKTSRD